MRLISGNGGRTVVAMILLAAILAFMLSPCLAETTPAPVSNQTAGKPGPQSPSLIQCDIGLILPLLLAGLVTMGRRAKVRRKK